MSTAVLNRPPCTHREETPVRTCSGCGCYLRSFGNEAFCDPCSKPSLSKEDHTEIIKRISEMNDARERRKAFEALADLVEGAE
jgi:hypothetical protein